MCIPQDRSPFRNAGLVRALIVHAPERRASARASAPRPNSDGAAIAAFRPSFRAPDQLGLAALAGASRGAIASLRARGGDAFAEPGQAAFDVGSPTADVRFQEQPSADLLDRPLGAARPRFTRPTSCSQTRDGLIVVDQHAAHERIVYERLKASLAKNGVQRQILLIPEIVELDEATVEEAAHTYRGARIVRLSIESFGPGAVAVRETRRAWQTKCWRAVA